MKQEYSKNWKTSSQPRKQRKYRANAALHTKSHFLNVSLSKELKTKYGRRSLRVRTGDKVKIMRGQFAKTEGKLESINTKKERCFVAKAEVQKRDGSKAKYPIHPSNLIIVELNLDDKERIAKTKIKQQEKK